MFKLKVLKRDSGNDLRVEMSKELAQKLKFKSKDKVVVQSLKKKNQVICDVVIDDSNSYKNRQVGIYQRAAEYLDTIDFNRGVDIFAAPTPKSLEYIRLKFENKIRLEHRHFTDILEDILTNRFGEIEITYFVLACSAHKLNDFEVIALTQAMIDCGKHLEFQTENRQIIVDKHCIGGVPNNRTTMLAIPIIVAGGLTIPKTSSRSITSPAGTADTMEVLANVELSLDTMHKQVEKIGGCVAWGGAKDIELSPVDDIIIRVEHPLYTDTEGQMIASILSKKKAAGSTHVLIDIPYGKHTKVETLAKAKRFQRRFEVVGRAIGLVIKVIITNGEHPIGNGIGPYFESLDVLAILANSKLAPQDLKEKALEMSGEIFELANVVKRGEGKKHAQAILESGLAYETFDKIRHTQGFKELPEFPKYGEEIIAKHLGKVKSIHNKRIAKIAFILGCPTTHTAGIIIKKKVGDSVKEGDILFELYAESQTKLEYALRYIEENFPYIY